MWLYDLPLTILGIGVVDSCVVPTWAGMSIMRRRGWTSGAVEHRRAAVLHQVIGVLYAVARQVSTFRPADRHDGLMLQTHPFWGSSSVQPDAFESVRINIQRVQQGM